MFHLLQHILGLYSFLAQLRHLEFELRLEPPLVLHVKLGRFQVLADGSRLFLLLAQQELLLANLVETLLRFSSQLLLNDHLTLEILLQLAQLAFE